MEKLYPPDDDTKCHDVCIPISKRVGFRAGYKAALADAKVLEEALEIYARVQPQDSSQHVPEGIENRYPILRHEVARSALSKWRGRP